MQTTDDQRSLYALHLGPGLTLYDGPIRFARPWLLPRDRHGRLRTPSPHRKVRPGAQGRAYRRCFRKLARAQRAGQTGWASPFSYERRCRIWFARMVELSPWR